ncbi:SDR family NAD(P)-dependent oxidoreductase [Rhizobium sp. C4]|uniref:SDR family NAD(P)-dependent oxidoreductase n=1 Tax=Rhizobium sp. C4 TaxID=1349800 RepID=UPI001E5F6A47|nr:SDR family oxidoreductase [Rhizobium sp. C4]MCD2172830.1 SDR family oxidoreductase [Rhizobium sp. C4]
MSEVQKIFNGKVALVTGGGSGIGRASSLGFAERGAQVVVSDVVVEAGEAVVAEIRAAGGVAHFVRADATRADEVRELIAFAAGLTGKLDIAHNNVGFAWGHGTEISEEDWDRTVDLSMKAPWLCMKEELPLMVAQGGGVIVNTASMAGVRYAETANIAYSAAKAGVVHMTRYAAVAYAKHNIRVNCVSPGLVRTPAVDKHLNAEQQLALAAGSHPIARMIEPREIADAVIWLASDASAMVTGDNVCVAGGQQAV